MSDISNESKNMSIVLEGLLIADGLLTLAARIAKWAQEKREVGELTPEEEGALDAFLEEKFASWQKRPGPAE